MEEETWSKVGQQCLLPPRASHPSQHKVFSWVELVLTTLPYDGVLSFAVASRHHHQLCKMGRYLNSFVVTTSVMFWQLTEEAGGGGEVRKTIGNFPSTSEVVTQQHKATADWFPVHLGYMSQAENMWNRRWNLVCLKQAEAHGSNHKLETNPVLFPPDSPMQKKTAVCWLRAVPVPLAYSDLKGWHFCNQIRSLKQQLCLFSELKAE